MPTYQYSCTECGHFFEAFQSFSEDSLTECPECGGKLRKVYNAVGVVFKGSGFYRTDSRKGSADSDSAASSSSSSPGSSSESSGATKPADSPASTSSTSSTSGAGSTTSSASASGAGSTSKG